MTQRIKESGTGRRNRIWKGAAVLLLLVLAGAVAVLGWTLAHRPAPAARPVLETDPNVEVGQLTQSRAETEQALAEYVEEGMVTFAINSTPMYARSKPEQGCNWMVENPPENQSRFTVTVLLDETGETLYESGYLDPEQYIAAAPFEAELAPGEYPCTAYFTTYSLADSGYIGQAGANLTLYIVN